MNISVSSGRSVSLWTSSLFRFAILSIAAVVFVAFPIAAQSPNTASLTVAVVDSNGAAISGAKVIVTNAAAARMMEGVSLGVASLPDAKF